MAGRQAIAACLSLLLCGMMVAGCASKPQVAQVSGEVTYRDEPVEEGTVAFFGPDDKVVSVQLRPGGAYQASNVPLGLVKVTVTTPLPPPPAKELNELPMVQIKKIVIKDKKIVSVPPRYSRPGTSGLSLRVKEGDQDFSIPLK